MANRSKKKNNKGLIIGGICALVVVIIIIIVAVINANRLGDAYFQSDGSKYVLTMEYTPSEGDDNVTPLKSHNVYTYECDKITGVKVYYQYSDDAAAKKAYDYFSAETDSKDYKTIAIDGKYVVFEANESEYKDLTTKDVESQIKFIESIKNTNTNTTETTTEDTTTSDGTTTETTTQTTEQTTENK